MWPLFVLLVAAVIAVPVLVLGAIAVVVAVASAMPWLLILVGAWLLVKATRGPRHDHRAGPTARPQFRAARATEQPRPVHQHARQPRPTAGPRRELPIDVQVKVEQIRRKADVLLGYADRFPPFSQDLYIVRQTAAEYLPRTVKAYLALPGDDDPIVGTSGKTALQELRGQLQLMDAKLDEITLALQRNDLDRLAANRRFLEERFDLQDRESPTEPPCRGTGVA